MKRRFIMDESIKNVIFKRIHRTGNALKANNIDYYYADRKEDVPKIVESLLTDGSVVANGGSVTLKECGVIDLLKSDKYKYLDREAIDIDKLDQLYRATFAADAYLCSANAITENGEIYNVDGNSNRIAAIAFGPKSVIMVVGYNKIVCNLDEAAKRVKSLAAPANTKRLNCATYCCETGKCQGVDSDSITAGCSSDARICCNYLISAHQRIKGRIKVIFVGECLGY